MHITVRLFAALAEAAGTRSFPLELPTGSSARDARNVVAARYPRVQGLCERSGFAVNAEYVEAERLLEEGDEVALIPPVSGG
jgi:molybdopterin converting factor subunit 1